MGQKGFSLFEIMVALMLMALVFGIGLSVPSSSKHIDEEVTKIERALGFIGDEATLKNAVVRLHFNLSATPQDFAVEYGPSDSFILPKMEEEKVELKKDAENKNNKNKDLNLKFNKVEEFQESNTELPEDVVVLGVGHSESEKLQITGEASVYSYPSGEKDSAIIILGTNDKVVALKVAAFNNEVKKEIVSFKEIENDEALKKKHDDIRKELFEKWHKEK